MIFLIFRPKEFHAKCNKESVALESVVDAEDLNWLQEILKEFQEKTGSKIAEEILHDWPAAAKDFVKVHYLHHHDCMFIHTQQGQTITKHVKILWLENMESC